jgi:hypothetical protein
MVNALTYNDWGLKLGGLETTSMSYRTKDIKCSELYGKRQNFLPLKNCACNLHEPSIT